MNLPAGIETSGRQVRVMLSLAVSPAADVQATCPDPMICYYLLDISAISNVSSPNFLKN